MILTIVRFPGATTETVDEAAEIFAESAARYLEVPGLVGKAYLRNDDGTVGAVYWWTDRQSAQARFNPGWIEGVTAKYGAAPVIDYCETPVIVDNVTGTIRTTPPLLFRDQDSL